jgi:transposase InsO family protein
LKKWFVYSALRSSIKAASQGNNALVASSKKTLERIHIDFYRPQLGAQFLVVVDASSKHVDVISVSSTTSRQTVAILLELFAQHVVQEIIVSDTGTQFTSHQFKEFCKPDAISHILSPHVPPQIK